MKWINNDVTFSRGNHRPIIAKLDNARCWLSYHACTTASGFKNIIRQLAQEYGAKSIEVKYLYDDDGRPTETNIVTFLERDSNYIFRNEVAVKEGQQRRYITYSLEDVFFINNERNNTMDKKETTMIIADIAKRADDMGLLHYDRMSIMMDLECADKHFGLDLNGLLNAEQEDFAHDILGIQNNIDRRTKTFENLFLPRFAAQENKGKPGEDIARREYIATRKTFYPEAGKTYENEGGGTYICLDTVYNSRNGEVHAIMENTQTGWVLNAHGVGIYEDGKIDWDYSTGGHFKENSSDVLDLTDEQSIGRK